MVDTHISDGACQLFGALLFDIRNSSPAQSAEHVLEQTEDLVASPGWLYAIERGEVRITTQVARNLQKVYRHKLRSNENLVTRLIELDEQPLSTVSSGIRDRYEIERNLAPPELGVEALGTGWGLQVGDLPVRDRQLVLSPLALGSAWIVACVATFLVLTSDAGPLESLWRAAWPAGALAAFAFLFLQAIEVALCGWVEALRPKLRKNHLASTNRLRNGRGLPANRTVWYDEQDLPYLRASVRGSYKTVAIRTDLAERLHGAFYPAVFVNLGLSISAAFQLGPIFASLWMPGLLLINILLIELLRQCADRGTRQVLNGLAFGLGYSDQTRTVRDPRFRASR